MPGFAGNAERCLDHQWHVAVWRTDVLEDSAGKIAFQSAVTRCLRPAPWPTTLNHSQRIGRLDPFSPQFQSMTLEKGAMVFHMLRWEMGDEVFIKFLARYAFAVHGQVRPHLQRADHGREGVQPAAHSRSSPNGWTAQERPRLPTNTQCSAWGTTGLPHHRRDHQDLDLFRMPIELRIETDGKTEIRRVDVSGTDRNIPVETFGRPRRIRSTPRTGF